MSVEAGGQQNGWRQRQDGEPDRPPEGGVEGGDTNRRGEAGVARELTARTAAPNDPRTCWTILIIVLASGTS